MEHPIRWGRLALLLAVFCVGCAIWCVGTALSSAWSDLARMRRYAGSLALIVPSSNRSTGIDGYEATYEPATFGDAVEALLPVLTNPTSERPLTLMSYARVPTEEWTAAARAAVAEGVPTPPMQLTRQRYPVASTGWGPSAYWRGIPSGGAPWLPLTLTAASVSIASFIVLPIARRRAKVRAAHLTRASVYLAAACLPLLCLVAILSSSFRPSRPAVKSFLVGYDSDLITLLPMALVLGHWWYVAVKHYLRMERPWAVAASVTTLGILSGVVADLAAGV